MECSQSRRKGKAFSLPVDQALARTRHAAPCEVLVVTPAITVATWLASRSRSEEARNSAPSLSARTSLDAACRRAARSSRDVQPDVSVEVAFLRAVAHERHDLRLVTSAGLLFDAKLPDVPLSGRSTETGSGGGCGGCGGSAGKGGGSGGASVALLSNESTVVLKASVLETKSGGAGGAGGAGGPGSPGGESASVGACLGGNGGDGAAGGGGAGGAGGVSVGVLFRGSPPTVDEATKITVGAGGAGGNGDKAPTNDGPPGGPGEKLKDASQL